MSSFYSPDETKFSRKISFQSREAAFVTQKDDENEKYNIRIIIFCCQGHRNIFSLSMKDHQIRLFLLIFFSTMATATKYALITGANRGLGLSCVKTLLERAPEPLHILLCSRSREAGERAINEHQLNSHRVSVVELDVTCKKSIAAAVLAVKKMTPSLSILINNAGILEGPETLKTNYHAAMDVTNAFLPLLTSKTGNNKNGEEKACVIATSSSCGTRFLAALPPKDASVLSADELTVEDLSAKVANLANDREIDIYALSKCALNCYMRILARDHPHQLNTIAVSPGFTNTGMCVNYNGSRQPKEVELGATVFYEALYGIGKGKTGIFLKQNSAAGTDLKDAESVETPWST